MPCSYVYQQHSNQTYFYAEIVIREYMNNIFRTDTKKYL